MPAALVAYITKYGLIAVFSLVFLQEMGMPNPVPTELVILFSGYLSSIGKLNFAAVFFTAVAADFIGTSILYFVFYYFSSWVLARLSKRISMNKIDRLRTKLARRSFWSVYAGRLLPYLRGYASVAAGILEIPPQIFLPAVVLSAITWSGGYVVAGKLLGPQWTNLASKLGTGKLVILVLIVLIIIIFTVPRVYRRLRHREKRNKIYFKCSQYLNEFISRVFFRCFLRFDEK